MPAGSSSQLRSSQKLAAEPVLLLQVPTSLPFLADLLVCIVERMPRAPRARLLVPAAQQSHQLAQTERAVQSYNSIGVAGAQHQQPPAQQQRQQQQRERQRKQQREQQCESCDLLCISRNLLISCNLICLIFIARFHLNIITSLVIITSSIGLQALKAIITSL